MCTHGSRAAPGRPGPPVSSAAMAARVVEAAWGPWPAFRLEGPAIGVTVVPAVGGRVVSLVDRQRGREWLTQADPPDAATLAAWAAEGAAYGARQSSGWDECLPSVTVCPDPLDPDGPPLRDHGDLWGRACDVRIEARTASLTTRWSSLRWPMRVERRMACTAGGELHVEYEATSLAGRDLPVLWSAHPALRLEPGTRIELAQVRATQVVGVIGLSFAPGARVPWPEPAPGVDLSVVAPIEAASAVKLYAATTRARVTTPDGASLAIEADGDLVRTLGVWLDAGGWPADEPIHQVALEPTGSADDDLAGALARGRAWTVPAGGRLRWWMRIQVGGTPG